MQQNAALRGILLGSLGVFLAVPSAIAQGPPPARIETAPVEKMEFRRQLTLVGRTEARSESRIVAEVSGRVRSVDALEGRAVKRGASLVTIDCRRLALSHEAKVAEAAQAEADSALAGKDLERARELVSTAVFPQRNLDQAEAEADRARERHRQLDAERRQFELDLENCVIRAPYTGHTVRKLVDVGEWVDPGTPVYEMVSLSRVEVMVDLPERRYGELELGSPVSLVLSGEEAAPLAGKVVGIAPRASEATHTFPVTVEVDNREGRLGSGMLVRATLSLSGTHESLAVPKDAVVRQGGDSVVYTVVEGAARPVLVTTGATQGSQVAIRGDGLEVGQPVVVRGNERLFPGSPVILDDAPPDTTTTDGAAVAAGDGP